MPQGAVAAGRRFRHEAKMRFTTKTEYGLVCMIYMAKNPATQWMTIKEIAEKERYPVAYI